jgi:hypothetical protein
VTEISRRRWSASIRSAALVLGSGLLLASCATTVPGTPVADPSGLAAVLDTGSFATSARTIPAADATTGQQAEGYRMLETVPLLSDVDPSLQYVGRIGVGDLSEGDAAVSGVFGSNVGDVVGGQIEVGAAAGASDAKIVAGVIPAKSKGITVQVMRLASEQAASAALADPRILATDPPIGSTASPAKVPVAVPGFPKAVAYTLDWGSGTVSTVGLLADKQFVLGYFGDLGTAAVAKYFDLQTKALDGFTSTPVSGFSGLPTDQDGILSLTLAPDKGIGSWSGVHAAGLGQSAPTADLKQLTDAGVDLVGYGGSTVYRTRDAQAAQQLRDGFIAESKAAYADITDFSVPGVPDAECITFQQDAALDDVTAYCVLAKGRYVSEFSSAQKIQAQQATAAQYLILNSAK